MRRALALAGAALSSASCALMLAGDYVAGDDAGATDASSAPDGAAPDRAPPPPSDGSAPPADAADAGDAAEGAVCSPLAPDGGFPGVLDLEAFVTKQDAVYSMGDDKRITLTPNANDKRGAAWYPSLLPPVSSYELTFEIHVDSGDTAGDGIAFAVLQGSQMPDVGDNGDGIGLRSLAYTGYAVVVDMRKDTPDDDDVTTLKLVVMPGFNVITHAGLSEALDDGQPHAVDVSWSPMALSAVVHGPTKLVTLTRTNPGFVQPAQAYLGFTASTGGSANAHQEIASANMTAACR
jgi:hypothetical protein